MKTARGASCRYHSARGLDAPEQFGRMQGRRLPSSSSGALPRSRRGLAGWITATRPRQVRQVGPARHARIASASRCAFRAESAHHSIAWAASVPNKSRAALAIASGVLRAQSPPCSETAGAAVLQDMVALALASRAAARGSGVAGRWAFHITRSPRWYIITDMQTSSRRFRG